jgi:predicted nuclease of predicted toxin-antitoxin system
VRFLADENVPGDAVAALRAAGHDVAWVRTDAPGSSDQAVLARAIDEESILVTFDRDFGELARRVALPEACGVVLLRIPMRSGSTGSVVAQILDGRSDWAGHFSVVEPGRVRMRTLGGQPS